MRKRLLERIKLIDHLNLELNISRAAFAQRLSGAIQPGTTATFSAPLEGFPSREFTLRGHVDQTGFRLKRRKRLFVTNTSLAVATGSFREQGDRLCIRTEINGFHWVIWVAFLLFSVAYTGFFVSVYVSGGSIFTPEVWVLAGIISLQAGIAYLAMRISMYRLRHQLEDVFYHVAGTTGT